MKRLPLVASFLLFIVLCASIAYWAMQLFKPPLRPVTAPPQAAKPEIRPEAAATLFGSTARGNVATASNFQLRGVVFSGSPKDSVAIISMDGKPAQAVRVGAEIVEGVTVKEVHRQYVLVSEGNATKRVDLPEEAPNQSITAAPALPPIQRTPTPMPSTPTPTRAETAAAGGVPPPVTPPGDVPRVQQEQPEVPGSPPQGLPGQQVPQAPSMTAPPTAVVVNPPAGVQQQDSNVGSPGIQPPAANPGAPPLPGQPAPAR